jgi:hypothetical protein
MYKRTHWPFSVKNFPPSLNMPKPFEIEPVIMKLVFEEIFNGVPRDDPIAYLKKFEKRCDTIKINHVSSERIKV